MLTSGDVVVVDLGVPEGSEAGMERPAVVVTADAALRQRPRVVQVVPLTRALRGYESEVVVAADRENGLASDSAAQCQHIRGIASTRIRDHLGEVRPVVLRQIRDTVRVLIDS